MDSQAAFIASILEDPDDDLRRLVYADWLDDQMDPRGQFIRLQIEAAKIDDIGAPEHAGLVEAINSLSASYDHLWIGELVNVSKEVKLWDVTFERGMLEKVYFPASQYGQYAELIQRSCPTMQELILFAARRHGGTLKQIKQLSAIRKLTIADWISEDDAQQLSTILGNVEHLSFWTGHRDSPAVAMHFARSLPNLKLLELVDLSDERDRTISLSYLINLNLEKEISRVVRPDQRQFPLQDDIGKGLFAGRFSDGKQAIVADAESSGEYGFALVVFNDSGEYEQTLFHEEGLGTVTDPIDLEEFLSEEYGFGYGRIFVNAFYDQMTKIKIGLFPDGFYSFAHDLNNAIVPEPVCFAVQHDLIDGKNFQINIGNSYNEATSAGKIPG